MENLKQELSFTGATMADIVTANVVYVIPKDCIKAARQAFRSGTVLEAHVGQQTAGLELDALSSRSVCVVSNERDWIDAVCASLKSVVTEVSFCDVSKAAPWTAAMAPEKAFEELAARGGLRRMLAVEHREPWTLEEPRHRKGVDIESAGKFLSHLFPGTKTHVFQTFTDNKAKRRGGDNLARQIVGSLEYAAPALSNIMTQGAGALKYAVPGLSDLMAQGAGVFFTVNEINLNARRRADNIRDTRKVLYADMDSAPLSSVYTLGLDPHAIVESSPGKHQVYWRVDKLPLAQFSNLIERIAVAVGGDVNVKTIERVMRLPGSLHQKLEPHLVTWRDGGATRIYSLEEFIGALEKVEKAKGIVPNLNTGKPRHRGSGGKLNAYRKSF